MSRRRRRLTTTGRDQDRLADLTTPCGPLTVHAADLGVVEHDARAGVGTLPRRPNSHLPVYLLAVSRQAGRGPGRVVAQRVLRMMNHKL